MSNTGDIYGKNSTDGDFCPNCGAVKVFSALVCPACGVNYAEASKQRAETSSTPITQVFDPNASYARFKSSLEKKEDTEEKEDAVKTEETAADTTVEATEEIDDPIKRKLAEITKKNSGMHGERTYRFENTENAEASATPGETPHPATNYGSGVWQSGVTPSYGTGQISGSNKVFSNEVSNKYNEYRREADNSMPGMQYASPYSRGTFDLQPERKSSTFKKILPLLIILILVGAAAYAFIYIKGLNNNEKGVEYDPVKYSSGGLDMNAKTFTDEWSEIRFEYGDYTDRYTVVNGTGLNNLYLKTDEQKEQYNMGFFYTENDTGVGAMAYTYKDGMFGVSEDEVFEDKNFTGTMLGTSVSYTKEPDMLLGDHVYKCASFEVTSNKMKVKMYMCVRKIGNRLSVVFLYDTPQKSQIQRLKSMFKKW